MDTIGFSNFLQGREFPPLQGDSRCRFAIHLPEETHV